MEWETTKRKAKSVVAARLQRAMGKGRALEGENAELTGTLQTCRHKESLVV
jgi:hypothetical protein